MAVRTILVTTRAAVESNRRSGREDLARAGALRGLMLLDTVEARQLARDVELDGVAGDARREIKAMLDGGLRPVGPGAPTESREESPEEEEPRHPPGTDRRSSGARSEAR